MTIILYVLTKEQLFTFNFFLNFFKLYYIILILFNQDIVVYEDVSVDTAPGADRFKVVPRTGAYEEIVILDNKPTHQMESCTDSSKYVFTFVP